MYMFLIFYLINDKNNYYISITSYLLTTDLLSDTITYKNRIQVR